MSEPTFLRDPPPGPPPRHQLPAIHAIAVSAADRWLAAAQGDGTVAIWQPTLAAKLGISAPLLGGTGHLGAARAVAFAPTPETGPEGPYELLASGGVDGAIQLWHLGAPARNHRVVRHSSSVLALAYAPGNRLVSGSEDGTVAIGASDDASSWPAHDGSVVAVAVSPDGRHLVTGGADRRAHLWDLDGTRLATAEVEGVMATVWAARFMPDGERILLATGAAVIEWTPATGAQRELVVGMGRDRIYAVDAIAGRYACAVGNRVGFGNPDARGFGTAPELRPGHTAPVSCVAYLGDGRVASGGEDGKVLVWRPDRRASGPELTLEATRSPSS